MFFIIIFYNFYIYLDIIFVIIACPQALPGSNKSSSWGDAGGTRQLHRRGGWGGVQQGGGWQQQVGEWDQHCWQERSISKYLQVMFSTQVNMFIFWLTRKSTAALFQVEIGSPPCQKSALRSIWSNPWILPKPRKNQSYSKIELQLKQIIFPCQTCKSVVQRKIRANPPLILKFPPSHKLLQVWLTSKNLFLDWVEFHFPGGLTPRWGCPGKPMSSFGSLEVSRKLDEAASLGTS